jgi:O-antigen ligase/polysaccharide polymerase Wzy-like membrane protein
MAFVRSGRFAGGPAAGNAIIVGVLLVGAVFGLLSASTSISFTYAAGAFAAVVLFGLAFVRTDFGIYVVIFSMLLSPEFGGSGGGLAEGRSVTLRTEDFVLIFVGLSWLAKTAVNKELGLAARTPLNRPILAYVFATAIATLVGYLSGSVGISGFFYVLKYVEYFFVYYMVVNNLRDRPHAWRMVMAAFVTATIVSLIALAQVPAGQRMSAPFEGEVGEPNTFGGYLLFMMALAGGIALETTKLRVRAWSVAAVGLMAIPFAFTLSRASYLGVVPAFLVLVALTTKRRLMVGLFLFGLICSPVIITLAPTAVKNRVLYTFEPEAGQPTIRLGRVGLDPSTSARLISFRQALEGWMKRPVLGHGVTGFGFMDAQYARVLVETGVIGLAAFAWLLWAVLKSSIGAFRSRRDPEERGLALGFLAGYVGLLVHGLGSNTFIIVRIMEPFWLFAGIVMMIPALEAEEVKQAREPKKIVPALGGVRLRV